MKTKTIFLGVLLTAGFYYGCKTSGGQSDKTAGAKSELNSISGDNVYLDGVIVSDPSQNVVLGNTVMVQVQSLTSRRTYDVGVGGGGIYGGVETKVKNCPSDPSAQFALNSRVYILGIRRGSAIEAYSFECR